MQKSTILILSLFFITLISCNSINDTKRKNMIESFITKDYDIKLIYSRSEKSKDSNGTEVIIILKDSTLFYNERHWGFKASNKVTNKNTFVDNEFIIYLNNFIKNEFPTKSYQKDIRTKKRFAFTTFKYKLFIKNKYTVEVSTNDLQTDNEYYNKFEKLYYELKNKLF